MNFRDKQKEPFNISTPSKIVIDTHGGLQDILAIVFAYNLIKKLGTGQEIVGITCVAGKNSLDLAIKSALAANMLLGTKIPVFRGQSESLLLSNQYPKTYMDQKFPHIEQNLYAKVDADIELSNLVQEEKAVNFLVRICKENKNNIGLVAFGPVTNLALAQRLEECLKEVKVLSLQGGQVYGVGNTVNHVEANFAHDPLAAHTLFEIHSTEGIILENKIYVNAIENTLGFCFKSALSSSLETGRLAPQIDQILSNMMGINSIKLNCGPILTVIPLIAPKSVDHQYHVYAEIVLETGQFFGLFTVNWLRIGTEKCPSFAYMYANYNKELITDLFRQAFVQEESMSKQ